MATPKPSVHARDHAPGAADTIPWLERIHMVGLIGARPAAGVGNKGALYLSTDESPPTGGGGIGTGTGLIGTLEFLIDGAGAAITTGIKGDMRLDFGCTITGWALLADQAGSIVVDLWKAALAGFPPTSANVITASAKPTLSAADHASSTALTGWTTAVAAGDVLRYNVNSAATVQRVTLALSLVRT
jgi:hypothetical protein